MSDYTNINPEIKEKILKLKLVILDVDGVLTDGRIIYSSFGEDIKEFDVKDGFGVKLLYRAGIPSVILSGKASRTLKRRAKDMRVIKVYQNAFDKLSVFEKIISKFKVAPEEVAFIGDDLVDLPVLRRVGFSACTACAVDELKEQVDYVSSKKGGAGAVREISDMILKLQGKWDEVTKRYFR